MRCRDVGEPLFSEHEAEVFEEVFRGFILQQLNLLEVNSEDMIGLESVSLGQRIAIDQIGGDVIDQPERRSDECKYADTEQDTDLPLKVGFPQNALDAVGHG